MHKKMIKVHASNNIVLEGLPDKFKKAIKDKLTVENERYHIMKNMDKSTYNTPKEFEYYKEKGDKLIIPRGLFENVEDMIKGYDLDCEFSHDWVRAPIELSRDFKPIELRDYQQPIVDKIEDEGWPNGVLHIGTGAGKTVMSLELIRRFDQKALILVHNNTILDRWVEEAQKFFDYTPGIINGKQKRIRDITVATYQTLNNDPQRLQALKERSAVVFVDECHGAPADTRKKIITKLKPRYLYGLTGTPERSDSKEDAIFFLLGPKRIEFEMDQVKPEVEVINTKEVIPKHDEYHKMQQALVENESRNRLIAGTAVGNALQGRKVLVLTKRIEHFQRICEHIGDSIDDELIYSFHAETEDREETLRLASEGMLDFSIIFGTDKLLSTGTNIPDLDTLIIACDMKAKSLVKQSIGRVLRLKEGKNKPKIIDIADITKESNNVFKSQFYSRKDVYEDRGYELI